MRRSAVPERVRRIRQGAVPDQHLGHPIPSPARFERSATASGVRSRTTPLGRHPVLAWKKPDRTRWDDQSSTTSVRRLGVGIPVRVIPELAQHPGAEDHP